MLMLIVKIMLIGVFIGCLSIPLLSFPMKWRLVWPMPLVGATGAALGLITSVVIGEFTAMGEGAVLIAAAIGAFITSAIALYAAWLGERRVEEQNKSKGGNTA